MNFCRAIAFALVLFGSFQLHAQPGVVAGPIQAVPYLPRTLDYSFDFVIERFDGTTETTTQEVYLQLPAVLTGNNPVILAFHGAYYNRFWGNQTGTNELKAQLRQLMTEAGRRGWITASLQAHGTGTTGDLPFSYGNPEMDQRITATLNELENVWGIRDRRIYTIGHSMGGCDAINYAARHQDPYSWRIAAAWSWSGVLDVKHFVNAGDFFWATGNYAVDPLPYIRASSINIDPTCLDNPTCGVLGTAFNEDLSQIFNAAEIPIRITHADNDICEAFCALETVEEFQLTTGELPNVSFDTSFNNNHATAEDFDAVAICDFFAGNAVATTLPSKGYKTVATEDGRYGYFDVTLSGTAAPGVFGWEFVTTGLNALGLPLPASPSQPMSGISELRFRVDDPSGYETPLVSTQWMFISCPEPTEPVTLVLENFLDAPGPIGLNGSPSTAWSYDSNAKVLTLGPAGPGSFIWEIQP